MNQSVAQEKLLKSCKAFLKSINIKKKVAIKVHNLKSIQNFMLVF